MSSRNKSRADIDRGMWISPCPNAQPTAGICLSLGRSKGVTGLVLPGEGDSGREDRAVPRLGRQGQAALALLSRGWGCRQWQMPSLVLLRVESLELRGSRQLT